MFAKLSLEDKEDYNKLIRGFPPFSDISFTNLHIWWNLDGRLSASILNQNLVLNYRLPFDKENSGYGLVGNHNIDESIQTIFVYLRQQGKPVKLVHIPEFVVEKITDISKLDIVEELDFHEYIMSSQDLARLEGSGHAYNRKKVKRFIRETQNKKIQIKSLGLSSEENTHLILASFHDWQKKFADKNDPKRTENLAIERTLTHSQALETKNLCLFIDGKLSGFALYHLTIDKQYYIVNHLKVDYSIPRMYDYLTNQLAIKAADENVPFLNIEMDLGIEGLREHKMGLRPIRFNKKYTVKPLN
jgi:hypothetical protein